jgi:hypothetical protein
MTTAKYFHLRRCVSLSAAAVILAWSAVAHAHCDALDGPVITEARKALEAGNVNLVLGWVQKKDEAEIRDAFTKVITVRKTSAVGKELADRYFFETLVRVHRAGEGASFTGLKPAGNIEAIIAAADKTVATGELKPVAELVKRRMDDGLQRRFDDLVSKKTYQPNDVEASRAYLDTYVDYMHYVESLYNAADPARAEPTCHKPAATAKPNDHKH